MKKMVWMLIGLTQWVVAQPSDTLTAFKIKTEAFANSEVMEILSAITNGIGPRLTNSKKMAEANRWTQKKLQSYGIDASVEAAGDFGHGWDLKNFHATVVSPYSFPLIACPKAWSPALRKPVKGKVIYIESNDLADVIANYSGKLKGATVMLGAPVEIKEDFEPLARRFSDTDLLEFANAVPKELENRRARYRGSRSFQDRRRIFSWLVSQEPALVIDAGSSSRNLNSGIINVQGALMPLVDTLDVLGDLNPKPWEPNAPKTVPQISIAAEQFNQIAALIKSGREVVIECDLQAERVTGDTKLYNTIGVWKGSDLADETVMAGAHLDSWHAATGATDNAQGVAVILEAIRILKKLNFEPRRTVRFGFWSGEEQGLNGSHGFVDKNLRDSAGTKAMYDKFSVYFNLDNGAGQIRGIYLQGNEKAESFFRPWFEPFESWGASTLSLKSSGGSDHLSFDREGLPGFEFMQDPIAYGTKTWHTNMDHYDHVIPEDMKRNAAIMAYFIYQAATQGDRVPRKQ